MTEKVWTEADAMVREYYKERLRQFFENHLKQMKRPPYPIYVYRRWGNPEVRNDGN